MRNLWPWKLSKMSEMSINEVELRHMLWYIAWLFPGINISSLLERVSLPPAMSPTKLMWAWS